MSSKNHHLLSELVEALCYVERGQTWFSPTFHRITEARRLDTNSFDKKLTAREQTILGYLGRGLMNHEIGAILDVTPRTVDDHASNIRRKLGIESYPKLVAFAVERGLSSAATVGDNIPTVSSSLRRSNGLEAIRKRSL